MQNKNILIVGASSGVGFSLAEKLIEEKANVFSASKNKPNLNIKHHCTWDATQANNQVFEELPSQLHGLVYCAGTINLKPFNRLSIQDFQKDLQINLLGAVEAVQSNLVRLKNSDSGASILFFSTVAVQTGMSFHTSVAAAKGAIEGLTRALAAELAPHSIRVNAIAPSLTQTPLAKNLLSTPEKIELSNKRHPLGRIGQSQDISSMAKLLLSNDGSWITGQIINIDGGLSVIR